MAEKIVSPGVFTNEIDASFLPAAVGDIGAAIVGPTVKGPALTPTVVSSYAEYQEKFGDVFKSGSSYYQYLTSHTAKNYLDNAEKLTVVRIMGSGFSHASATISSSVDPGVVGGGSPHTGSITVVGPSLSLAGTDASASFTPAGGTAVKFKFTSSAAPRVNSTSLIHISSGSTLTLSATNFANTINNSASQSLHKLNITASSAAAIVSITSSLNPGEAAAPFFTPGAFGVSVLQDTKPGGTSVLTHGGSLNVINGEGMYVALSGVSGVTTKSLSGGRDFNDGVMKDVFKLHTLSDGDIMNSQGTHGTNGVLGSGTMNNLRFEIASLNQKKGTFSLLIRRGDDTFKRKQVLENFSDLSLDPNSNNYIGKMIGDARLTLSGTASDPFLQYVGDYPNKSKYVRVEVLQNTVDYLNENGSIRLGELSASLPTFHSGSNSGSLGGGFAGGTDGTTSHPINFNETISDTNTQGFNLSVAAVKDQYTKALNLLSNNDEYDFNLLFIPGIIRSLGNHTSLVTKAIDVCEQRGDAFVVVDTVPYGTTTLNTVTAQSKAMDSNFAATYWPWVKVPDLSLGKTVWIPPSSAVAGVYSLNDRLGHPWFAPAGLNRGTISTATQAERKLTQSNRDTLYESNVNPIATFPAQGVCVWGQKTLQKKDSALDRVNVRRLLIRVKKFVAASSRFLLFEQNNAQTRQRFLNIANPFFEQVQSQSGLNAFKVVMDETNNTPDVVDRNQLFGQIFLQPTKTAEFIVLDFTVQPTGATFPE